MLTSIRLGNFKAFATTQRIPIRPITLIFGPNSAGKSSLLHGLLLAQHAAETGELDARWTALGGDSVDLGGFRQYIHRSDQTLDLEWGMELDATVFTGRLAELLASVQRVSVSLTVGVEVDNLGRRLRDATPHVRTYTIEVDGSVLVRMSRRQTTVSGENYDDQESPLRIDVLDRDHPVLRAVVHAIAATTTTTEHLTLADVQGLGAAVDALVPQLRVESGKLVPTGLPRSDAPADLARRLIPISRNSREADLANAVEVWLPPALDDILRGVSDAITRELSRLCYLGPLRSYPPRHLHESEHEDPNWLAGGGFAWREVRTKARVREDVNAWLSEGGPLKTHYHFDVRRRIDIEAARARVEHALEPISEYFAPHYLPGETEEEHRARIASEDESMRLRREQGLNIQADPWVIFDRMMQPPEDEDEPSWRLRDRDPSEHELHKLANFLVEVLLHEEEDGELVLVDQRTDTIVSHRDIGIGISQVLPVLVTAFANTGALLAIEQPEIHLHPALQAELGDVFIQSALGHRRNTFILETHSEHLILRIMRRMRDTVNGDLPEGMPKVRPEDVAILYVDPIQNSTVVRTLRLDDEGELIDPWPGGFFEEGFRERFA